MYTGQKYSSVTMRAFAVTAIVAAIVLAIFAILSLFHQQVVPSNTHDAHPQGATSLSVFWVDSERLGLSAPYNYTSKTFTTPYTADYVEQWTCYPSANGNTPSYSLTIVIKDTATNKEQTSLVACNELTPPNGNTVIQLTGTDPYTVTITSDGPWTLDIQRM